MPQPPFHATVVAICVVAAVACGGSAETAVEPVRALIAEEIVRIGSVDDPETALTSFEVLEVAPDGRIITLHDDVPEGRIHARDGSLIAVFGGPGDGPGEFARSRRMGLSASGLWVYDDDNRRFSYFDLDGAFLGDERFESRAWDAAEVTGPPRPYGKLGDGSIYGHPMVAASSVASGEVTTMAEMRLGLDGSIVDTILIRPLGGDQLAYQWGQGGLYGRQPYADSRVIEISRWHPEVLDLDRALRPDDGTFRVTKSTIDGDTIWSRAYSFDPVSLPPAAADSFVDAFVEQLVGRIPPTAAELEDGIREALFIPDVLPAVARLVIGRDGSTWLERGERVPGTTAWLVLDSAGDVHGEVELAERFRPYNASLDDVWGELRDDLDVSYIVGYAVRPAVAEEAR
ncbi:MAG: hypothetical protein R3195_13280 [Gemmatimonadota bacterium]|nr:hypothetical protein [Gemmatimonadota bacterium]